MKYKKTKITLLSLIVFYLTMHVVKFTNLGYMLALLYESGCFSDSIYKGLKQETEGSAPGEFHFTLDTKRTEIELIPCLLYYRHSYPKRINIAYRVLGDTSDCQYLDLSRLELVLKNGKKESLLPPDRPFRVYLKDHENARDFWLYEDGDLTSRDRRRHVPRGAEFRLSGRSPSKQVTLVAEGTLHRGTGEDQPFRQVAAWQLVKNVEWQVFGSLLYIPCP